MCGVSIKFILVSVIAIFTSSNLMAAGDRLDLRLGQAKVDNRIATPRLALGTLKEKTKEEELQVTKKRSTQKRTTRRVSKDDKQRKKKTKRVVASQ